MRLHALYLWSTLIRKCRLNKLLRKIALAGLEDWKDLVIWVAGGRRLPSGRYWFVDCLRPLGREFALEHAERLLRLKDR